MGISHEHSVTAHSVDTRGLLETHLVFAQVIDEIAAVDLALYEPDPTYLLEERLVPRCFELLGRAKQALQKLGRQLTSAPSRGTDKVSDSHRSRTVSLDQVCFIAGLEMTQLAGVLRKQSGGDPEHVLLASDRALRRARRALEAVQDALRQLLKLPELDRRDRDLKTSLLVRNEYARFRREAEFDMPATLQDMSATIRTLGDRLAVLMGRPAYRHARLRDRLVFRGLQERILQWLSNRDLDIEKGSQLLSDFAATLGMLRLINLRSELRRHDALQLELALEQINDGAPTDEALLPVRSLIALNEDVDRRIRDCQGAEPRVLSAVVEDLLRLTRGASWS